MESSNALMTRQTGFSADPGVSYYAGRKPTCGTVYCALHATPVENYIFKFPWVRSLPPLVQHSYLACSFSLTSLLTC